LWDGLALFRHSRFLYPPLVADLFRPLAALRYQTAKLLFTLAMLGAWLGAAALVGGPRERAVVLVASALFVFATQPMFRLRLTTENDLGWYGATVTGAPVANLSAGQVVTVPVTITNYGLMTWPASGVLPVHISYHWLSAT